jgi:hypothetical protein
LPFLNNYPPDAVVIASGQVARDCSKALGWIIGTGEATQFVAKDSDFTVSRGAQSRPVAFEQAGPGPMKSTS